MIVHTKKCSFNLSGVKKSVQMHGLNLFIFFNLLNCSSATVSDTRRTLLSNSNCIVVTIAGHQGLWQNYTKVNKTVIQMKVIQFLTSHTKRASTKTRNVTPFSPRLLYFHLKKWDFLNLQIQSFPNFRWWKSPYFRTEKAPREVRKWFSY